MSEDKLVKEDICSYANRIIDLEQKKDDIVEEIKDIYKEAEQKKIDQKALKKAVSLSCLELLSAQEVLDKAEVYQDIIKKSY